MLATVQKARVWKQLSEMGTGPFLRRRHSSDKPKLEAVRSVNLFVRRNRRSQERRSIIPSTTCKSAADFAVFRSFEMALTVLRKAKPWKSNIFTAFGKGTLLLVLIVHLLFVAIGHLKAAFPPLLSSAETAPSPRPSGVDFEQPLLFAGFQRR